MAELAGFTLFIGNKGWQMSIRPVGEEGWSVHHIDQQQADELLAVIGKQPQVTASLTARDGVRLRIAGKLDLRPRRQRVSLD